MYTNTVEFIVGNYTYFVEEIQTSTKVAKLLIKATHDNGKVYHLDPVYGIGEDVQHALYKAYMRIVTNTTITNKTQLQFVMKIGDLAHNIKEIMDEDPI